MDELPKIHKAKYTRGEVWLPAAQSWLGLIKYGVAPPLLLLQAYLPGSDMEHLIEVDTLFPKGAILTVRKGVPVPPF